MKTRNILQVTLPLLLVAGGATAVASARDAAATHAEAVKIANKAQRALGKRDTAQAVALAEQAVALSPRDAALRALLGRGYLQAGRFQSARDTLEEAVSLDAGNGRAALDLALAQIACGDWAVARRTLDAHARAIPAGDRGLAQALAGDPAGAVALLTEAARAPGATAKTRQNLALALALSGQWRAAKLVAEADMAPADVDRRMVDWAAFAQPRAASDQVASLLGVTPVEDGARPVSVALNAPVAPVAVVEAAPAPAVAPATAPAPVVVAAAPVDPGVTFAPMREVVQALPVRTIPAAIAPAKLRVAARVAPKPAVVRSTAQGGYVVQLGAFGSADVAHDGWNRATKRFAALRGRTPTGVNFRHAGKSFYRLAVAGLTRGDADGLCRAYRAKGGSCFVRLGAGDRTAAWVRRTGVQLAMR